MPPSISIITVVYNAEELIERTIKSVLNQSYSSIEFIVVDGASTDNTLNIINNYAKRIAKIVSEKDNGIYDAMNKGLKLATSDYVLFLNAGDELFDTETLKTLFNTANADVFYGNTAIVNSSGKILGDRRLKPPANLNWKSLRFGMCVSHQSFIAKRLLCDFYNTNYTVSADIDWVINVLKQSESIVNTHSYISKFLEGGTSNKRRKKALFERFRIMVKHYGFIPTLLNHIYILIRFPIHLFTRSTMS